MAEKRSPITLKDKAGVRLISVTNGLWQPQKHDGTAGTREHDPWQNIGGPLPLDEAKAVLNTL